jgi:sulfatase maturation enzyme AslB (radical SAM superfamily)
MTAPSHDAVADAAEFLPTDFRGHSIDIYLNSTCNLKCRTCFLGDEYFSAVNDMDIAVVGNILRWAKAAAVKDVAFLGGEPSLHPKVFQILELSRSIGIPANRFITNGTRPFARMMSSAAADYIDWVYVSLDGPSAASNDAVRGRGTFSQAIRTMALLRDKAVPFTITTSIAPSSYDQVTELLSFAERSACKTLNIHWVSPTGRARDGRSSVAPERWLELCDRVQAYKPMRPDLEVQCQLAYTRTGAVPGSAIDTNACAVRDRNNLQFMPDGSVYACGLLVDRPSMNGYRWAEQSLRISMTPSELTLCESAGAGCPARRHLLPTIFSEEAGHYIPLCIYQRLHNATN